MKKIKKNNLSKASESEVNYLKTNINQDIQITSFEESEEIDHEFTRGLSHLERLAYLNKLISITHGNDLSEYEKAFYNGKITFRNLE